MAAKRRPGGIGFAFHGAGKIRKNKKWLLVISGGYKNIEFNIEILREHQPLNREP